MRAFLSTVAFAAPVEAGSDTAPAADTVAATKLPRAPRKPRAAKPALPALDLSGIPGAEPAADTAPVVTAEPAAEPAPRVAPIARTCATIARNQTNFGGVLSDRDLAYIAFFASFAKAAADGIVTVRAIVDSGNRPAYSGSNKPHDAGVVNRLRKAGIVTVEADGTSFSFTDAARTHKAYASA